MSSKPQIKTDVIGRIMYLGNLINHWFLLIICQSLRTRDVHEA